MSYFILTFKTAWASQGYTIQQRLTCLRTMHDNNISVIEAKGLSDEKVCNMCDKLEVENNETRGI